MGVFRRAGYCLNASAVLCAALVLSGCSYQFNAPPVDTSSDDAPSVSAPSDAASSDDEALLDEAREDAARADEALEETAAEDTASGDVSSEDNPVEVGKLKPEIDYSNESPGCELAADRLSENVQVGMTLGEVRRLVGKPRVILPGRWFWTRGIGFGGRPMVSYGFGPADSSVRITAFSTDIFGC